MPKELLELIKAVNAFKEQKEEDLSFEEFIKNFAEHVTEKAQTPCPFEQSQGSYKVRHLNGTITVLDLLAVDIAQIRPKSIYLTWAENAIEFFLDTEHADAISKDEYTNLANFLVG
jgi:hypothetical protein